VIGAQIEDLTTAQKQLQYQASHDFLTGLWNRRALLEMLHLESERAARNQSPVGILILDVDHFKAVNDRYGHLTGDVVLQEIAGRIRLNIRPYDVAGRYGGEEFLVILPGCDPQQAMAGAERIRKGICDSQFQTGSSAIPLTVSIGASVNPGIVGLESDVLSAADRALYAAKRGGRNRTTLHDVRLASEAAASSGGPSARAD
jgi:diguanylate cyclase (GGDEF)-like protein